VSNRKRIQEHAVPQIAQRLRLLRMALAPSQAEFCRLMGFPVMTWNTYETGKGRISIDSAIKLVQRFGVTLDWIYLGNVALMPNYLVDAIAAAKELSPAKPRRQSRAGPEYG
jgi:transcriptional regulator with XRE-family HTH domain